jgi:branched-subunit amino acid aminotransferase/4-amino-4-deoxychorismate lyase
LEFAINHSAAFLWDNQAQEFRAISFQDLSIHPMDLGILHGAMVVERLRTFNQQLPNSLPHWKRLSLGCQTLGIRHSCSAERFSDALLKLLDANRTWIVHEPDVSMIAVATPGNPEFGLGDCTLYLHLQQLPWTRLHSWYLDGTSLVSSQYATGAGISWPAPIKVRNRLGYYLADRDAKRGIGGRGENPRGLGLLRTTTGSVADTSVANLLMIDANDTWISPRPSTVMLGTSFRFCESLLAETETRIIFRDICFEELGLAKELILVGNTGCVWHASEWDGQSIGDGRAGSQCRRLQDLWIKRLGFDWLHQGSTTCHQGTKMIN